MNVQFPAAAIAPALTGAAASAAAPLDHAEQSFHEVLAKASASDKKLADTAKQFEGVMAGEVLKAARTSSGGGWLGLSGSEDDQTGEMVQELAEQGLAQGLANSGTLGIAKMVIQNMQRNQSTAAPAKAASSATRSTP